MQNSNDQKGFPSPEMQYNIKKEKTSAKNNAQVSSYISEGNPNTQESPANTESQETEKQPPGISNDQQLAQVVQQAIKDDQSLAAVADDIRVTVKDGAITLDGKVSTEKEMNLVTSTATAVGVVDEVNNRMEIIHNK